MTRIRRACWHPLQQLAPELAQLRALGLLERMRGPARARPGRPEGARDIRISTSPGSTTGSSPCSSSLICLYRAGEALVRLVFHLTLDALPGRLIHARLRSWLT